MSIQIADTQVAQKVEYLSRRLGLSKTAVIERAVDRMIQETDAKPDTSDRMSALLAQIDQIPDRRDGFDPLEWDEHGLPR
jgi:antitoxin VapB